MKRDTLRPGSRQARTVVRATALALAVGLLTSPTGSNAAEPAGAPGGPAGGPQAAGSGETYEVTLITGDVVEWREAGGHASAVVRDKAEKSTFRTVEDGDDYYVIPSQVSSLVGKSLDRELFNVAALVEQGYHDRAVGGTPVIMTAGTDSGMRKARSYPGLNSERSLPSIHGVAGTVARTAAADFGYVLAEAGRTARRSNGARSATEPFGGTPLAGVEKIWLDAKVDASLEESVPQTGAPKAWEAGYKGEGTTIAVLDTGIDAQHPDLAGKIVESKDFTGAGSVADGHGHGTHVASTAAGTGAADKGLRKGVAPGADLAVGKVLDDEGSGPSSAIIAGMEWAAGLEGVDVVSMSLGGSTSDGTDPMSQALNKLTEEHGVLFVVAAGNDGPGKGSVSYPGTADDALTVGAVDKSHELAYFSSRGPRAGDGAIKPEITAPGVGIKAARAEGTSMGEPVGQYYTAADGTSMATPHVAGAVALLKQQHPDWGPSTLKSALINSATPNEENTVHEQGGGELDLAKAVGTSVVSSPGVLNLGNYTYPHEGTEPVTKKVKYTNLGDKPATLDLQAAISDGTAPAPEGMVTVEPSRVTLEPGASTEVAVTLDLTKGAEGLYDGSIVATGADGRRVATPASFFKEAEMYELKVEGVQRNGAKAASESELDVLDAHDRTLFGRSGVEFVDGVATLRVPPGTYSVVGLISTEDPDAEFGIGSQALLGDPEIKVDKDTRLVLDARDATEITVGTPYKKVKTESHALSYHRGDTKGHGWTSTWSGGTWPYYSSKTEQVGLGKFGFATKYELSAPGVWMDLNTPETGAVPADLSYEVKKDNTVLVDAAYHADVPDAGYSKAHTGRNPWEYAGFAVYRNFKGPLERTEIYSANATRWEQAVTVNSPDGSTARTPEAGYPAGKHLEHNWYATPRTPSLDEGNEFTGGTLPSRTGNTLNLLIFEWGDSNSGAQQHYAPAYPDEDKTAFRLFQDGKLVKEAPRAIGNFAVGAGDSRLRLELDVARDRPFWTTSTQTRTAWEFDSATAQAKTALPLLQVDYDVDVDLTNTAVGPRESKGPFTIGLDVRQPRGVQGSKIEQVKAWLSYDDGKTWKKREVKATGAGGFEFRADRRDGGGAASIRIEARDADGNRIEQEVIRAYKLRP